MGESRGIGRRDFLKRGGRGIVGAAVLGAFPQPGRGDSIKGSGTEPQRRIIQRTLGRTGIRLPVLSMGVMNSSNPDLVRAALDSGIVHLDTAWIYQRGQNEIMIGEVLKGRPRDSFVIATKVYENRDRSTDLFFPDAKAESFIEKFHASLKRLQLDAVDILYLHNISRPESVVFEPFLEAMLRLKKEGKVRHLGVSTHRNEPEIIRKTADCGHYDVVLTSYNFRQQHHAEIASAAEYAAGKGMGIVGMKAIAGVVRDIRGDKGQINARAALKWALQNENFHTNIAGFTTFEQLKDDLPVMEDLAMTGEEILDIEKTRALTGVFCQQCGRCVSQCPHHLEIPDLMRSYMYARGYRNLSAAKEVLETLDVSRLHCRDCAECSVSCSMGFDVRERVLAVAAVRDIPYQFIG